jgi:opacity protein-like surface antigen
MKKTKYLLAMLILAIVFFNNNVFSQGSFNIHGGLVMPTSDWGDDDLDDEDSGLQGTGFNLGAEGIIPLTDKGLGLFIGADFNLTSFKKGVKDDIEEDNEDIDFTYPKAIDIPISAGLHYTYKPNDKIGLYGKGGIAFSFLKTTDFTWEEKDYGTYTESYEMANSFGLTLGGGIILNDKITFGISYFGLGEHSIKGEYKVEYDDGSDSDKGDLDKMKKKVSFVTLTVGIKL